MTIIDIILTANHNLRRSKMRTFLTIIAIFIGAFTVALTLGLNQGINSYVDTQTSNLAEDNVLIISRKVDTSNFTGTAGLEGGPQRWSEENDSADPQNLASFLLNQSDVDKIRTVNNLDNVQLYSQLSPAYIRSQTSDKYRAGGTEMMFSGGKYAVMVGQVADPAADDAQVMISETYLTALGFDTAEAAIGQIVYLGVKEQVTGEMREVSARITAVVQHTLISTGGNITVNKTLADDLLATQFAGLPEDVKLSTTTGATATMTRYEEADITATKDELSALGYNGMTAKDQIGAVKNIFNTVTGVLVVFGVIALFAASFGIVNTLLMSVQERTREIGLMKAIGMSNSRIYLLFAVEAIVIGFWGSLLGVLAAVGVGEAVNRYAAETFAKGLDDLTLIQLSVESGALIIAIIMLVAFISSTLPSLKAARQDPITALRYE